MAQGRPPFAFAVKGEELPRQLEWSSFSRELPLFPSTIVLRKPRLRLDEHVHAHGNGVRQPGTSRLNRDIERSDVGKYLAGDPIRAYEARGTPAKLSVKAFAAVAKAGLVYGKDRPLNEAFASAMDDYLKHREVKHDQVTAEKQLSFCSLIPDNALYMESGVQCIEYHWRKGDFLVSANRSEVASYVLKKVRDYVRQLEWTKD